MELKYFGYIDCRGKYAKTANFVMKYIYERIGTTHEGDAGNRIWGLQECSKAAEHENL